MELHNGRLYLSLGADDCASTLFHVPLQAVLRLLRPLDRACPLCPPSKKRAAQQANNGWGGSRRNASTRLRT